MNLPDITQLLDSKALLSAVSVVFGGFLGTLLTVLRNRVKTLEYTVRHDRVAIASNDTTFGPIDVTWQGHSVVNLFISRVELENQTSRDLTGLKLKVYTGPETLILSGHGEIAGTTHVPQYTNEYSARIAVAPGETVGDEQLQTYLHSREYAVSVLNRGQRIVFTYLTSVPNGDQGPSVWLDLLHQGLRVQYRPLVPHVHGTPVKVAVILGLLTSLIALAGSSILISEPWAVGLICLVVGLTAQSIGAGVYKLGRNLASLVIH